MAKIKVNGRNLSIQALYDQYLELIGLTDSMMGNAERIERKKSFMAGATMLMTCYREIAQLPENDAVRIMEELNQELLNFHNPKDPEVKDEYRKGV